MQGKKRRDQLGSSAVAKVLWTLFNVSTAGVDDLMVTLIGTTTVEIRSVCI